MSWRGTFICSIAGFLASIVDIIYIQIGVALTCTKHGAIDMEEFAIH